MIKPACPTRDCTSRSLEGEAGGAVNRTMAAKNNMGRPWRLANAKDNPVARQKRDLLHIVMPQGVTTLMAFLRTNMRLASLTSQTSRLGCPACTPPPNPGGCDY